MVPRPVGIYVSVPFCRAKCTFCNFASDAFPPERMQSYVDRLLREIDGLPQTAAGLRCELPEAADSIYLGGGTPSLLSPGQLELLLRRLRERFHVLPGAEITLEAAPGQIDPELLETAMCGGVNRLSLGVQSFVDREASAVGRRHTGALCRAEIARLQADGVPKISVDLIAGLPFQTRESWAESLHSVCESKVEHVSVYMLETDGDSRLGREVERVRATSQLTVLGEQARYHAASAPSDEVCAELYLQACEVLAANGICQYEISNFARSGGQSRHNRKYWERAPYVGLGLDAHSMLLDSDGCARRFQNADELDTYLVVSAPVNNVSISHAEAFEEAVFLGLRLTEGVAQTELAAMGQPAAYAGLLERAGAMEREGLLTIVDDRILLTPRGRVLSSAVFGELLIATN